MGEDLAMPMAEAAAASAQARAPVSSLVHRAGGVTACTVQSHGGRHPHVQARQRQSTLASAGDALGVQGGALLPPKVFARRHVPIGAWHRLDDEVDQFGGGRRGAKEVVVEDAQLACGGGGVRAG